MHFLQNVSVPSSQSLVSGRVDWNLGSNDRVFLLAQFDHGHIASFVDAISPVFDAYSRQPWWQGQLSETHTIGPTAANQFLLGLNYILAKTHVMERGTSSSRYICGVPTAPLRSRVVIPSR